MNKIYKNKYMQALAGLDKTSYTPVGAELVIDSFISLLQSVIEYLVRKTSRLLV